MFQVPDYGGGSLLNLVAELEQRADLFRVMKHLFMLHGVEVIVLQ